MISLVCCHCLISQPPKHINDDLVTVDDKADIPEHITGMKEITVIVHTGVTRKVDNWILC